MRRWFVLGAALMLGVVAGNGCGMTWNFDGHIGGCWDLDEPRYTSAYCIGLRCSVDAGAPECDAGTPPDDGGTSSDGAPSARCSGTCVHNQPDGFDAPQPAYFGPPKVNYAYGCSNDVGAFGGLMYFGLVTPAPGCPSCVCGPIDGTCAPSPNSITLRAGTCDVLQTSTLNFTGPENWDGSCTTVNAIPAGLECPPGSGIPCAQSIYSSSLLDPVEGCEPIPLPIAKATSGTPWWTSITLSCKSTPTNEACDEAVSTTCLPPLPTDEPGWRYCVRQAGVHECPALSDFTRQFVSYPRDGYVDTRKCTECGCKSAGGTCYGMLSVFKDGNCTDLISADQKSSDMTACSDFLPPGQTIGSKEITDLLYVPGKCEPTGGLAIGTVVPNDAVAVTWCCMPTPGDDGDAGADASSI